MATRILLIRHGATTLSAEDRFAGATDVPLSDEGRHQARALGARLAGETVAAIYTSPLGRTRETAAAIAKPHGLEPIVEPGLREIDHGHWEGLTRQEVESRFAEEYDHWEEDPLSVAPQGGENGIDVIARAVPVLRSVVLRHPGQAVAVVSHKATIRLLVSIFLGLDARSYRDRLDQSPACLNVLDFKDAVRAKLTLFNDTSHYADWPRYTSERLSKWWDDT